MLSAGDVRKDFELRFGRRPDWVVQAPGRVNLIGEHVDYNGGLVLPMAIQRHTIIAAAPTHGASKRSINAYSQNLDAGDVIDFDGPEIPRTGTWADYVRGVLAEFLRRGFDGVPLDLYIASDIPMGCGLSSSAALQVATARLLQALDTTVVNDDEIAELCQSAEQEYAGVPVGIMDQFCIANARQQHLLLLDCHSLDARHIPFDNSNVRVLIIDSRVSRELRSGAYAERRAQCAEACRLLGVVELRDVLPSDLETASAKLDDTLYRRTRHVVSEIARTRSAAAAVSSRDWHEFGRLMFESHESMAHDYEVSCPELDLLVEYAKDIGAAGGVFGARMTGGGFGGCVVALVEEGKSDAIIRNIDDRYRAATKLELRAFASGAAHGAIVVDQPSAE